MGVLTTTREMPAPTKIKRGLGLLLLGVLGVALSAGLFVIGDGVRAEFPHALVVLTALVMEFAAIGAVLVGLVLLAWGLLRD